MSHVDEGRLHAFLDGALSAADPADAERVELHLAACSDCRARLEESARLRDEASALLQGAQPRAFVMPSFDAIRTRSTLAGPVLLAYPRRSFLRSPFSDFAWAAMVVLAIGLGWMLNDTIEGDRGSVALSDVARPEAAPARTRIDIPLIAQADSGAASEEAAAARVDPTSDLAFETFAGVAPTTGAGERVAEYGVADEVAPPPATAQRSEESRRMAAAEAVEAEAEQADFAPEERARADVQRDQVSSRAIVTPAPPPAAPQMAGAEAAIGGAAGAPASPADADWRDISVAEAERLTEGKLVRIAGARITSSAARGSGEELEVRTVQLTDRGESIKVVQRRTPALDLRSPDADAQAELSAERRMVAGLTVRVEQWTVTISGAVAPGRLRELAANLS